MSAIDIVSVARMATPRGGVRFTGRLTVNDDVAA
jgi:hypothetical protein